MTNAENKENKALCAFNPSPFFLFVEPPTSLLTGEADNGIGREQLVDGKGV